VWALLFAAYWRLPRRRANARVAAAFALGASVSLGLLLMLFSTLGALSTLAMFLVTPGLFWLGVALGRGLRVILHSGQAWFERLVYGYEGDLVSIDESYLQARVDIFKAEYERMEAAHLKLKAELRDTIFAAKGKKSFEKIGRLINERMSLCIEQGMIAGAQAQAEGHLERVQTTFAKTGKKYLIDRQACEATAGRAAIRASEIEHRMHMNEGVTEYLLQAWQMLGTVEARDQMAKRMDAYFVEAYNVGSYRGIYKEMTTYMVELDARYQAAGGQKTAAALEDQGVIAPTVVSNA